MCGRFTLTSPTEEIAGYFRVFVSAELQPRYNVAPTQPVACVRQSPEGERELVELRWGLIPYWAKDASIGNRMINARAETVAEKSAYKEPFRRRRCLVVADGFYEWKRLNGTKQPYFIFMADQKPFGFAGLWDRWNPRSGPADDRIAAGSAERVESCSFVTTEPNELLEPIHDRMPAIVPPEHWETWLDPGTRDLEALREILGPYPAEAMCAYPVSTHVNSPDNDDAECIKPLPKLRMERAGPEPAAAAGDSAAATKDEAPEPPDQPGLFD